MDPRLYMLAGTLALLVIAVVAALISILRTSRARRSANEGVATPVAAEWSQLPPEDQRAFDPNLSGLNVEVAHGSPSAALLTPLRTGLWQPPDTPALPDELDSVALDRRIAEHPAPPAEPVWASAVPTVAPSPAAPAPAPPALPPTAAPGPASMAPAPAGGAPAAAPPVPAPVVAPPAPAPVSAPRPLEPGAAAAPALVSAYVSVPAHATETLPEVHPQPAELPDVPPQPVPPEPAVAEPSQPVAEPHVPVVAPAPLAQPAPQPSPATVPTPEAEALPRSAPLLQPPLSEPSSASVMVPPVVFDPMSESIPVAVLASGAVAGTPAATTAVSEAEAFEEAAAFPMLDPETSSIAESSMSESRTAPESGSESSPAVAVVVPAAMEPAATAAPSVERPRPAALQPTAQAQPAPIPDRPAVVIHAPAPAAPAAPAAEFTGPTRPPRPRTVVRSAGVEPAAEGSVAARIAPLAASATPQDESSRGRAPEFVLAAPIEMWFGEHRVGVKAGTRTYEQFRRYADTLFEDLKAADNR